MPQQVDGFEVLATAVTVRDPLAVVAGVVEVEHRRDAVDAQTVGVVAVDPRQRARDQERAHLEPAVVEDRRLPLRVEALARVGVLEQVRAVEAGEAVRIVREVRRHPVEDDADAALVQVVDQPHQPGRVAVARGRGEVPGHLVAPRPVERVLHHGHQLDVREPVCERVLRERLGELVVRRELPTVGRERAAPRPEVDLVDADRRVASGSRSRVARSTRRRPTRRRGRR